MQNHIVHRHHDTQRPEKELVVWDAVGEVEPTIQIDDAENSAFVHFTANEAPAIAAAVLAAAGFAALAEMVRNPPIAS